MRAWIFAFLKLNIMLLYPSESFAQIHHVDHKPHQHGTCHRRATGTPLVVTNMCGDIIYPGIITQAGTGPNPTGFELQPGATQRLIVSENWQGRIWGRTNCSFNSAGTGPANAGGINGAFQACGTGDCAGQVECQGQTPVTLAEITMDAGDGHTYYDISLVDGYNLPLAMVVLPDARGHNASFDKIPPNLTNPSCVGSAGDLAPQGYNPYGQGEFLGTNASYPLPFDESVTPSQIATWCPWNLQVRDSTGPKGGIYTYPDGNLERPAFDPCFSACAKSNLPQDCCTGAYDSPSTCQPSSYSKAAKSVCPDAYSYGESDIYHSAAATADDIAAFDDQTSTFVIPAGAGFEVVFCPGARSTNILATSSQKLVQLIQTGSVTGKRHLGGQSRHSRE